MTETRLEAFVRGVAFRETDAIVVVLVGVVRTVLRAADVPSRWSDQRVADRVLVKIAALALAFLLEVRDVLDEKFELDFREEAVLDAVLAHLGRGES